MEKLAIKGGYPVRSGKIYYGRQWIDDDDVRAVASVLKSDFITCGPKVEEMERSLEAYTGAKYAVAVCNGTAALHCACIAAGIGPGDEVITTPLTFAASANCALYCGATPVFADIDPETYNDGKQVGSLADMTCFSFHPVKTITGGEGGAVTTNNEEYYKKLVLAHTHGITHDEAMMEGAPHEGPWYYEQINLGYNYRITDFQAALIVSQMSKLEMFAKRRKEIVKKYNEAFSNIPELIVQKEIPESDTCRHLYIIRLVLDRLTCTRREFFDAMSAENVQCQIHYVPVYWFPYYQHLGYQKGLCPKAEAVYQEIMSIPLYPKMTDQDVEDVIHAVKKVICYYAKNKE